MVFIRCNRGRRRRLGEGGEADLRPSPGVAGFAALRPGASAPKSSKKGIFYEAEAGPQGGTRPPGGPPPPPPFPSNSLGVPATNHGTPCVREPGGWPSTPGSMRAALKSTYALNPKLTT